MPVSLYITNSGEQSSENVCISFSIFEMSIFSLLLLLPLSVKLLIAEFAAISAISNLTAAESDL